MSNSKPSPLDLDVCFGVVSAIIERQHEGETEILVQTRWKPERDPEYSGTLEIPAGGMGKYENVYDALRREVLEETGLQVLKIKPDIKTEIFSSRDDGAFAFVPFCCQQQTKGGVSRVGFVFLCEVEDKAAQAQAEETKDIRWIKLEELGHILEQHPEQIFTFQLAVLSYYLSQK